MTKNRPNFVPLLDKTTPMLSLDAIKNPTRWKGKRCFLSEKFFPGRVFGFKIKDRNMEPQYGCGDIVLVDTGQKPKNGDPVVIKLRNLPPICRIYWKWRGPVRVLKTWNDKALSLRVRNNYIEWHYKIIKNLSQ